MSLGQVVRAQSLAALFLLLVPGAIAFYIAGVWSIGPRYVGRTRVYDATELSMYGLIMTGKSRPMDVTGKDVLVENGVLRWTDLECSACTIRIPGGVSHSRVGVMQGSLTLGNVDSSVIGAEHIVLNGTVTNSTGIVGTIDRGSIGPGNSIQIAPEQWHKARRK